MKTLNIQRPAHTVLLWEKINLADFSEGTVGQTASYTIQRK